MPTTYQDVVRANGPYASWAFTETAGLSFVPWIGSSLLTGHGTFLYQQAGPFGSAFALIANTSGYLTFPFPGTLPAPWTLEFWMKLGAYPPAAAIRPMYSGDAAANNGAGWYVTNAGVWHKQLAGTSDVALAAYITDTAWHLIQFGHTDAGGGTLQLAVDGAIKGTLALSGYTPASPATWGFLADAVGLQACPSASISYPAVYPAAFTAQQLLATFIAATDPASALMLTRGAATALDNSVLEQILASVRKVF